MQDGADGHKVDEIKKKSSPLKQLGNLNQTLQK
jgi:hypothetical protein